MDTPDLLSRLHDTLCAAQRIRLPGPGCTAGAAVESVDEVKGMLRGLIRDLGGPEPAHHAPRQVATAVAFPASASDGARPVVQHRRRVRRTDRPDYGASTPSRSRSAISREIGQRVLTSSHSMVAKALTFGGRKRAPG